VGFWNPFHVFLQLDASSFYMDIKEVYEEKCTGEMGLSVEAKPRLRWTEQLHQQFVHAISQLGGADSMFA
jgi:hypothetical protein